MSTYDFEGDSPKKRISRLIENSSMPQTLIVEGGENASRKELALYIARNLVCEKRLTNATPCDSCPQCKKVDADMHPDVKHLVPEEGKSAISVEQAREVKATAYVMPFEADCKVYIADNAEKLNAAAQNAILKLIEEPPANVYFIFCCATAKQLLQTVCSRAMCISVGKLTKQDIVLYLKSVYPKADKAFLDKTARLYGVCDDFDPEALSEEHLKTAYEVCTSYFSSGELDFSVFKKKSASNDLFKLIFNILAVGARDIYLYQMSKNSRQTLDEEGEVLLDASVLRASTISISKAMQLYDAFTDAAIRLTEYANINVITSMLSAII